MMILRPRLRKIFYYACAIPIGLVLLVSLAGGICGAQGMIFFGPFIFGLPWSLLLLRFDSPGTCISPVMGIFAMLPMLLNFYLVLLLLDSLSQKAEAVSATRAKENHSTAPGAPKKAGMPAWAIFIIGLMAIRYIPYLLVGLYFIGLIAVSGIKYLINH